MPAPMRWRISPATCSTWPTTSAAPSRACRRRTASTAEGSFKGLIEGIELTERDLLKTLERHGVKKLDPQGQKFDPNVHQAMFEIPNADVPSGTVVQVVQSGYVIGDRVLRPALVGVAKGGPKAPPTATAPRRRITLGGRKKLASVPPSPLRGGVGVGVAKSSLWLW